MKPDSFSPVEKVEATDFNQSPAGYPVFARGGMRTGVKLLVLLVGGISTLEFLLT